MFIEQKGNILCPICGIRFTPNGGNICPTCTLSSINDDHLLTSSDQISFCTYCLRFERPPWILCERQSPQLLGILLKKVKGLSKVELIDAKFIWTESHSKRMKIKIEYVRVVGEAKIQQSQIIQFVQKYSQCPDCRKNFTPHDWKALIQIRQHCPHPRTLLALEQNLTKGKWSEKTLRVETVEGGLDLYFRNEQEANVCLTYIKSHVPVVSKTSSQFVSHNERDNTSNVKTTYALIIPKICKDDILVMHPKFSKKLGCSSLLLCTKVASQLYFMDPTTFRRLTISPSDFFSLQPYSQVHLLKNIGKKYLILDNQGSKNEESHNLFQTWGLIIALSDEMKEIYLKSQVNGEIGCEYEGYCLDEWIYIKNLPNHLLVRRIKSQEQMQKKRLRKDQKRKEERVQKKAKAQQNKEGETSQAQGEKQQEEEEWEELDDEQLQI